MCVIAVQAAVRGFLARKLLKRMKEEKRQAEIEAARQAAEAKGEV
jgi:hypothetical protein